MTLQRPNLSAGFVMRNYYIGFVPFIVSFLFPLFTFIAVIFFTSRSSQPVRDHSHTGTVAPALTGCLNPISWAGFCRALYYGGETGPLFPKRTKYVRL